MAARARAAGGALPSGSGVVQAREPGRRRRRASRSPASSNAFTWWKTWSFHRSPSPMPARAARTACQASATGPRSRTPAMSRPRSCSSARSPTASSRRGSSREALDILRKKKKGNYAIVTIDPSYMPPETETREIFGIGFEQKRNTVKITVDTLKNVVTEAKEHSFGCTARPASRPDHPEIYAVEFRVPRPRRADHRRGRRPAVAHPLHAARGCQG